MYIKEISSVDTFFVAVAEAEPIVLIWDFNTVKHHIPLTD